MDFIKVFPATMAEEIEISACFFPNYHGDLNAIHEAEMSLNYEQAEEFNDLLMDIAFDENRSRENPFPSSFSVTSATAPQRCEAYLRTIGKWVES